MSQHPSPEWKPSTTPSGQMLDADAIVRELARRMEHARDAQMEHLQIATSGLMYSWARDYVLENSPETVEANATLIRKAAQTRSQATMRCEPCGVCSDCKEVTAVLTDAARIIAKVVADDLMPNIVMPNFPKAVLDRIDALLSFDIRDLEMPK